MLEDFNDYLSNRCSLKYNKPEWQRLAKIIFPELLKRVNNGKTWSYSDIGRWLFDNRYTNKIYFKGNAATKIGFPVGLIGQYCVDNDLPLLNVLVVHKDNKYLVPGEGSYVFINKVYGTNFTIRRNKKNKKLPPLKKDKEKLTEIVEQIKNSFVTNKKTEKLFSNKKAGDLNEISDLDIHAYEGDEKLVAHIIRERNQNLVSEKKKLEKRKKGKLECEVCGFCFSDMYGDIGSDFIECHHKIPIAKAGPGVTTCEDLALVCSNCHRMIHKKNPCYTLDEMKAFIHAQESDK